MNIAFFFSPLFFSYPFCFRIFFFCEIFSVFFSLSSIFLNLFIHCSLPVSIFFLSFISSLSPFDSFNSCYLSGKLARARSLHFILNTHLRECKSLNGLCGVITAFFSSRNLEDFSSFSFSFFYCFWIFLDEGYFIFLSSYF